MINVKYYEERSAYDADESKLILPNLSFCKDTEEVFYNPKPHDYSQDYLTFVAEEGGTFKFSGNSVNYSVDDGETWIELANNTDTQPISAGGTIMFKAELTPSASWPYNIGMFSSTGRFTAQGNVMSLLYGDNFIGQVDLTGKGYAFSSLFQGCTGLTSALNLSLPATTLSTYCYQAMFRSCTSLTAAPSVLPATTLANYCYYYMFQGCTSLTTAPVLPATTLANYCYQGMFQVCKSLTTAPELPATTAAQHCYQNMFNGCTSLATAPELPATTLATNCYSEMFQGCKSLTTTPELPATTLATDCYSNMFSGCANLNKITCLATDISANSCTFYWVSGVAASGTFIKAASMTSWTTGKNGIPSGWTVEDYQG